jgi:hypothetical protein
VSTTQTLFEQENAEYFRKRELLSEFIGFLNGAGFVIRREGETGTEAARELINRFVDGFDESEREDTCWETGYQQGIAHLNMEDEERERYRVLYGRNW